MSDELDSFFDEVDQAETTAVSESASKTTNPGEKDENENASAQPLAKKKKLDHRPRGVVVAAASSAVSKPSIDTASLAYRQHHSGTTTETAASTSFGSYTSHGIPPPPPPKIISDSFPETQQTTSAPKKAHVRTVAGKTWTDATLADWPDDDFRLFVGNLDPTVTDALLQTHFNKYASLQRVRVIRDNKTNVSAGYGFVSLHNALECAAALREQDQTWLGGRPIRIKRSHWKDREWKERQKKKSRR